MLEQAHGKAAIKKMQIYGWHKHGSTSVNDDPHSSGYSKSMPWPKGATSKEMCKQM